MIFNIEKQDPNHLAAIDDAGCEITYGNLMEFCLSFSLYIPSRSFIFILSENVVGSFVGYIASLQNKIVPLIISASTDNNLFANLFNTYVPEYLWVPSRLANEFQYEKIYSAYGYVLLKTDNKSVDLHNELSLLLPTSGSTGSSKLVRHSYKNIESSAYNVSNFFEITSEDKPLAILPMHYTMGLSVISSNVFAGATILLVTKSMLDPEFWKFLKEQKATSITGVPYSYEILKKLRFTRMDLPKLNLISQGGGKMTDENFKFFAQYAADNNKRFIATYGQTECTARMAYLPANLALEKIGSIGKAIPNGKLYLIDDNGTVINDIEATGQLVYEGDNVTMGYAFNKSDFIKGDENLGVMKTGDIARRDEDGCYYIVGRQSRFLKLFGYRVSLDECEIIINDNLNIESACTGDDNMMDIYITSSENKQNVKDLLVEKTNLIATVFNVIVVDSIPRNESGKIMYSKLIKI